MDDTIVDARVGKEQIVARVVPIGRKVGSHIDRIGCDRDRRSEDDLLPAGGSLAGERGGREQLARAGPQISDVGASITGSFVEANAGNQAAYVRSEFDTELHRIGIGDRWVCGYGRATPATAWTRRARSSREGPGHMGGEGVAR